MIIFLFFIILLIIDYSFIQIENFYDDPILLFSHLLAIIFKYILLSSLIRIVGNRNNRFKYFTANMFFVVYLVIIISVYLSFYINGSLPNYSFLSYLIFNHNEALEYLNYFIINNLFLLGFYLIIPMIMVILNRSRFVYVKGKFHLVRKIFFWFFMIAMIAGSHNNARFIGFVMPPEFNSIFSMTKLIEQANTNNKYLHSWGEKSDKNVIPLYEKKNFDILIIVNESLRAISLTENSLSESIESKTLKYLNDNYSDNFFYFNKAFSNSTFTNTSLITILSGWNPSQNIGIAYNLETIFDKAKLFKDNKNFFFSSQDLNHSGLKFFFDSKSIDYIYHYENGNKDYSEINLSALKDEHIYDEYKSLITESSHNFDFNGVLQFNGTHYPYIVNNEKNYKNDRDIKKYNDSIKKLDDIWLKIIYFLEKENKMKNTLIIFTSDHGEGFYENNFYGHMKTFYDEEARIPFWIFIPPSLKIENNLLKNLRINTDKSVSNNDIIPTLNHIFKIKNENFKFSYLSEGYSLLKKIPSERIIKLRQNYLSKDVGISLNGLIYKNVKILDSPLSLNDYECLDFTKIPENKISCTPYHDLIQIHLINP